MLKIAHLDTERTWRGGERQVLWLAQELSKSGHENHILCRKNGELHKKAVSSGFEVFAFRDMGELDVFSAIRLRRYIMKNKLDILHAHTAHAVTLAALALSGTQIPLVATRRVDFGLRSGFFSRWKYSRCAHIIAISGRIKDLLISGGLEGNKISIIHSGIDEHIEIDSNKKKAEIISENGLKENAKLIVNVAALAPHKDQGNLIESAAILKERIPEAAFIIVGEGSERRKIEKLIKMKGLEDNVKMLGFREDALDILQAADVFVLSSSEEGLGSSILDAMWFGIPVVATETGGIPDVITDPGVGLLVPPKNPPELANALYKVLSDGKLYAALGKNSRERVKHFSMRKTVGSTLGVYKDVLASRNSA